jgi:hypothetical protein
MSIQSQKKLMKAIAELLSQDLGYIYGSDGGEKPSGAKKKFLSSSAVFLRTLGKDLGFTEMRILKNPSGIACSGSVSLYGMWERENGACFVLSELVRPFNSLMYRGIRHIKDYCGDSNRWMKIEVFEEQDYERLCYTLLRLKTSEVRNVPKYAA